MQPAHPFHVLMPFVALLAVACGGTKTCPDKPHTGEPKLGDVNADDRIDISDGVYMQRYAYRGGPEPVCDRAWDMHGIGEAGTAVSSAIWSYLFTGEVEDLGESTGDCSDPVVPTPTECAHIKLDVDLPRKIQKAKFNAKFSMWFDPPDRGTGAEAWSFSLVSEGCKITGATTLGTAAADKWDGGIRDLGFEKTQVTKDGAVSSVVLSWWEPITLDGTQDILALEIEADQPSSGCERCRIRMEDGGQGDGRPVKNIVTSGGFSYRPELASWSVKVCAP